MENRWQNYFLDTWKGYKISHDNHLKEAGNELFWMFEEAGLLYSNFVDNSLGLEPYRRAYCHTSHWDGMEIPTRIKKFFKENFIDYLDINDECMQLKVEELKYVDDIHIEQHNKNTRVHGITPSHPEAIPEDYAFGTAMWHTDRGCPLHNMVMMIYLEDVDEGMGEFVVADPVRQLYNVDEYNRHLSSIQEKVQLNTDVLSNEIGSRHLTGPAGTVLGFNSHILHRANMPHRHRRRCIHMNIESPLPQHKATGYHPQLHGSDYVEPKFTTVI